MSRTWICAIALLGLSAGTGCPGSTAARVVDASRDRWGSLIDAAGDGNRADSGRDVAMQDGARPDRARADGAARDGVPPDGPVRDAVSRDSRVPDMRPFDLLLVDGTPPPVVEVRVNEYLADPAAVRDEVGEWFELHNYGKTAVNLLGYRIADQSGESHVIAAPLTLAAGGYAVLGRERNTTLNGGVKLDYVYSGFTLQDQAPDAIMLYDPYRRLVSAALFTSSAAGASTQRSKNSTGTTIIWCLGQNRWAGVNGDVGTPGTANDC